MFNQSGITKTSGVAPKQILLNVDLQFSMGIKVAQTSGVEVNGKKIIKAGTPMAGDLNSRLTAFTKAIGTDATGVLLHDVDVTAGNTNATLLVFGFVNTNRLDADVKALLIDEVKTALAAKVTFIEA